MMAMVSQITGIPTVHWTVCSGADKKNQSSADSNLWLYLVLLDQTGFNCGVEIMLRTRQKYTMTNNNKIWNHKNTIVLQNVILILDLQSKNVNKNP